MHSTKDFTGIVERFESGNICIENEMGWGIEKTKRKMFFDNEKSTFLLTNFVLNGQHFFNYQY